MIRAKFLTDGGKTLGFEMEGHSGYAEAGADIICAAVSSAVRLCECAITDVLDAQAKISVDEENARISLKLSRKHEEAENILTALMLHLVSLRDEYPDYIEVLEV